MANFTLEILTDIFIDSGKDFESFEYDIDANSEEIFIYDVDLLNQSILLKAPNRINDFHKFLEMSLLNKKFNDGYLQSKGYKQKNLCFNDLFEEVKKYVIDLKKEDFLIYSFFYQGKFDKSSKLNFFSNDGKNFFIPGSSLKGVLRNAIANEICKKNYINEDLNKENLKKIENDLDKIFKKNELNEDLTIFRDAYKKRGFSVCELNNFMSTNGKTSSLELYLVLNGTLNQEKKNSVSFDIQNFKDEWFLILNNYSISIINLEISFISDKVSALKKKDERTNFELMSNYEKILDKFNILKSEIEKLDKTKECIFPIGKFTNWVSKSIPSFYEKKLNYDIKRIKDYRFQFESPKFKANSGKAGQKVIPRFFLGVSALTYYLENDEKNFPSPMGWVKLKHKDEIK